MMIIYTDRAADMITGKINAEKRSLQVQGNALESLTSSDIDTIGFLLDGLQNMCFDKFQFF